MKTKMKTIGTNSLLTILSILIFSACTSKMAFMNSAVVPAAEGTIKMKQDKNSNYNIDLTVKNLAEPSRLTPPKNVYVVWMESSESRAQNIGQLKTSSKGLSQLLTSSLQTVSPHKPTGFFITAEEDASGSYPGNIIVLKTTNINN